MNKTMLTDDNLRQIKETHTNMLTVALAAELLAAREEVARLEAYTDYKNMRYTTENAPDRLQVPRPVWERLNCENASLTAEREGLREARKAVKECISVFECVEFEPGFGPSNELMNALRKLAEPPEDTDA
jgi:hypothetical protein